MLFNLKNSEYFVDFNLWFPEEGLPPYIFTFPDIDECKTSPCKNGGICSNTRGGYTCKCASGFKGKHCEQGNYLLYEGLLGLQYNTNIGQVY